MSENLGKIINNIMEENSKNRVAILTDHLYITGTIHDYKQCENCQDCLISLKKVKISKLNDLCNCNNDECACEFEPLFQYEWFNIAVNKIIGFSII